MRITTSLLAMALLCTPALAQEDGGTQTQDAATAAAKAAVAKLSGTDEALLGTTHFGIYLDSGKNIGTFVFTVSKAEGDGAYKCLSVVKMNIGPQTFEGTEDHVLSETLSLVSSSSNESETKGGKTVKKATKLSREGDEWACEVTRDEETKTLRAPVGEPNYWEMPSMVLLSRKLAGHAVGDLAFSGMAWSPLTDSGKEVAVTVAVAAASEVEHRGAKVQAQAITFNRPGKDSFSMVVDAKGKILEISFVDAPIKMITGTEEQSKKNLDGKEIAEAGAPGSPDAAVLVYFEVLAKSRPVEDLDKIMDWEAIRDDLGKADPNVLAMDPAMLAQIMKGKLKETPQVLTAEQIEAVKLTMTTKVDGDKAVVDMPGAGPDAFKLSKGDSGWKITRFPH